MKDQLHSQYSNTFNTIKLLAEWEQQSFIQYTFPHKNSDWAYMYEVVVDCFVKIITTTAQFEPVLVICHSKNEVSDYFKVCTKHPIFFTEIESNDTWARDHGAITVYHDEQPILLDFTFNGWGQKFDAGLDNQISLKLAQKHMPSIEFKTLPFILEGGAIESDGQGTLLTTSECLLSKFRNPDMSQEQITEYLKKTFGLKKVLWLNHGYLAGDDTDSHIDTLARFCSPNIIAYVKCTDKTDEHYDALQQMEVQLKSFTNSNNAPYQFIELPFPDACYDADGMRLPATYANFSIVNNGILVPTYGVPQDNEALSVIQNIFPERKVIGVDCRPLIEQHGSLHCISMQYPKGCQLEI